MGGGGGGDWGRDRRVKHGNNFDIPDFSIWISVCRIMGLDKSVIWFHQCKILSGDVWIKAGHKSLSILFWDTNLKIQLCTMEHPYDGLSQHITSMQNDDNDTCMIQVRGGVLAVSVFPKILFNSYTNQARSTYSSFKSEFSLKQHSTS